jgi:phosphohistidine phosphatase SixA
MPEPGRRFVILVRHGKRHVRWDKGEAVHELAGWATAYASVSDPLQEVSEVSNFSAAGLERTVAIAGRLADELRREQVRIGRIGTSHHVVAEQTAQAIVAVLRRRELLPHGGTDAVAEPWEALDPDLERAGERVRKQVEGWRPDAAEAWILVGHQPHLTDIADTLTRSTIPIPFFLRSRSRPGATLPLGGSEAACVDVDRRRVVWMLTEKSEALMKELQDKVKSKYDVAKFFLGAFVVNAALLLKKELFDKAPAVDVALVGIGVFCALLALGFTAATLFSYDRLLMPAEFWTEGTSDSKRHRRWSSAKRTSLLRPPSQAQLVLFYEMLHAWKRFFIPAVTFAFASIALFVISFAHRAQIDTGAAQYPQLRLRIVVAICVAAFAIGLGSYLWKRPRLGTPD